MPNIITSVNDIETAETEDLVATYNHLTGGSVKRFSDRAVAKRRVEMALLAAKDADSKTGLPKGAEPQARGRAEIEQKAAERGIEPPPALEEPVFKPGTMAYELDKAAKAAKPIERRPTKAEANKGVDPKPKKALFAVVATFTGTSKPQAGSTRNAVLLRIQNSPKSAAMVDDLNKHFQCDTRGYIQKLAEKGHITFVDDAETFNKLPEQPPNKPQRRASDAT